VRGANIQQLLSGEVSKAFADQHRDIKAWRFVAANVREDLRARVNKRLAEEGIADVQPDAFRWRMDQAVRNAIRACECCGISFGSGLTCVSQ
jgi:hypothetical protein